MEIKREYYLDKLIKRQNNGLIKVITGIRRCGKSYLLNTLFYNYLIESVQRYDIKGKDYIETPKKYYFSDLGLRNARINFRQFEQTHSMENVIYNKLRMRG